MSKEKKPSKDELELIDIYERLMRACMSPAQKRHKLRELLMRHKSLIESSSQEPSDKYTSAILDELHEVRMDNSRLKELFDSYKYPGSSRPSEAELEEFVGKYGNELLEETAKRLRMMLKEYDELRRG